MNRANRYWLKAKELEAAIERVRKLHRSYEWDNNVECVICPDTEYPCDTIKALDEESEYPKGPVPRPEPEGENNE
jgi:hypothetical protein